MPTYLYLCEHKHGEFEEYHSISQIMTLCPKCKEEGLGDQELKQLINCSTKGVVELTGQDLVDSVKSGAKQLQREAAQNENTYSNLLGTDRYQQLQTQIDRNKR
jgi:hypothetical protein